MLNSYKILNIAEKANKWLFHEGDIHLSWSELHVLFLAILIQQNTELSLAWFHTLQKRLLSEYDEITLYNVLGFIPYTNPSHQQKLMIYGIPYEIHKIQLTSGWLSAPYYAYGLKALQPNYVSYLLFQGTTIPTDNGFLAGLLADTSPFYAIGGQLYARGGDEIQRWINAEFESTQQPVICIGQSLGGAMCLHAHIHQPDKVDFVAINPPTLTDTERAIYQKPKSNFNQRLLLILSHHNDPVWSLGDAFLPDDTQIFKYGQRDEFSLFAHARCVDKNDNSFQMILKTYEEPQSKYNFGWKFLKILMHLLVLTLFLIALPIRLMIKAGALIFGESSKTTHQPMTMR